MELVDQLTRELVGGHLARQDDAKSPGSDGASPYLPALPRPRCHPLYLSAQEPERVGDGTLILSEIVNGQSRLNFSGPALQGGEDSVLGFVVLLVGLGFELERKTVSLVSTKSSQ